MNRVFCADHLVHEVVVLAILQPDFVAPNFKSINTLFNLNSMKQNPPWEANSFLASQEIPLVLWTLNSIIIASPPMIFLKMYFNIILPSLPGFPNVYFPSGFPMFLCSSPYMPYTCSIEQSPSWEANWLSASQEIPHILWNLKVH